MSEPKNLTPPPALISGTAPEQYLRGGLRLGNTYVPYFATSMSVRNAVAAIDLPSNLPVSDDVPISIDELFQRELDEDRVQDEICLLYTSPSPRDQRGSRMPSSA